jgi:hypothetical protein
MCRGTTTEPVWNAVPVMDLPPPTTLRPQPLRSEVVHRYTRGLGELRVRLPTLPHNRFDLQMIAPNAERDAGKDRIRHARRTRQRPRTSVLTPRRIPEYAVRNNQKANKLWLKGRGSQLHCVESSNNECPAKRTVETFLLERTINHTTSSFCSGLPRNCPALLTYRPKDLPELQSRHLYLVTRMRHVNKSGI